LQGLRGLLGDVLLQSRLACVLARSSGSARTLLATIAAILSMPCTERQQGDSKLNDSADDAKRGDTSYVFRKQLGI